MQLFTAASTLLLTCQPQMGRVGVIDLRQGNFSKYLWNDNTKMEGKELNFAL